MNPSWSVAWGQEGSCAGTPRYPSVAIPLGKCIGWGRGVPANGCTLGSCSARLDCFWAHCGCGGNVPELGTREVGGGSSQRSGLEATSLGSEGACRRRLARRGTASGTGGGARRPGGGAGRGAGAGPRPLQQRGPGQGAPRAAATLAGAAVKLDPQAGVRGAGAAAALQRCDSGRGPAGALALRGRGGR